MTRVYLSGPMTGIADNNFPAFHRWAAKLRADGFDVVSPAEIQEAGSWELCLRADLRELCTCDSIALMPGWEGSRGAHLELHVAHRLGMKVMHLQQAENSRLIAAAPDMLQALVKAREELACCNVNSAAERIAHAIERAAGGAT